jgi:predicted negative regulator of RcsB-dependent stress response
MRRLFCIAIPVFISCHVSMAQYDEEGAKGLIKAARLAWQAGDTSTEITHLTTFYRSYPDNMLSGFICLKLGKIYIDRDQVEAAQSVLTAGLKTDRKWHSWTEDAHRLFFPLIWGFHSDKSEICVLLSEIAQRSSDHRLALHYLQLADKDYFPSFNCGNQRDDYKAVLSLKLANAYVKVGDTAMAIDRLFESVLDRYEVAEQLKPLLLARYTQQQIIDEINTSIARVKIIKDRKGKFNYTYFKFVAFKRKLFRSSGDDLRQLRDYLDMQPGLVHLRKTPTPASH